MTELTKYQGFRYYFSEDAEPQNSGKSAKSHEIHKNMQNTTKFTRNIYQIHVDTTYLKRISAIIRAV